MKSRHILIRWRLALMLCDSFEVGLMFFAEECAAAPGPEGRVRRSGRRKRAGEELAFAC
jgi:hypothetical protein